LVEWQTIDIQQARGSFHVQLHQIDQRRASAQEARRRTLMSRFLLRRSGDDSRCVWGPDELKDVHRNSLRSR